MRIFRIANLIITIPRESVASLFDQSTGILLTPFKIIISQKKQKLYFPKLWRGNFVVNVDNKKIKFNINKNSVDKLTNDILIETKIRISIAHSTKTPGKLRNKYIKFLNNLGWNETIKNVDKLTAVCEYLSLESQKEIGRKAFVIPTSVPGPTHRAKNLHLKHPSACLIQNHQIKQKSEALIQFVEIIKKTPQITYYISRGLSENQNNENYQKVISKLKKLKNVILSDINHQNKYDYLYSTDIYILASGLDCTPATIIEAYHTGKPVLASRVGGIPEMIIEGRTGWSIKNEDQETWVKTIEKIINDKAKLKKIGESGKKVAETEYSFSKVSQAIYKEIA